MASRRSVKKPVTAGSRVGTKHSDMRWQAPDGTIWASRLEYEVYEEARRSGEPVRRCVPGTPDKSDTFSYWHSGRSLTCKTCGSAEVGSLRRYTADLFQDSSSCKRAGDEGNQEAQSNGYYVDIKGYLRGPRRTLLRSFCKRRPDVDLRILLQRDFKISKLTTAAGWINKTLKIPYAIWDGKWPRTWIMPIKRNKTK